MVTAYTEYECLLQTGTGFTLDNVVVRPQIEVGGITPWEGYNTPFTYEATTDGEVYNVELSPSKTNTLLTNTEGVAVRIVYNRDTNKVIQGLVDAIISLGGNV